VVAWLVVIASFGVAIALAVSWTASGSSADSIGSWGPSGSSLFSVDDGVIPDHESVGADSELPAVTRLEPALLDALRQASDAASIDGQTIDVTSGWRSVRYQEDLFAEAVVTYGSEEAAREFVAPPTRSKHVTGDAVDVGPLDAQFWLIEHGSDYGLCQTYANERWHFELATTPGGVCPEMLPDASGDWS
jgi:D-alanyl-D-alanine carboxypeptidase